MNVRFKKTDKGEVAILPRKEYEALAAKAAEADEDIGAARLVARARKEIAAGAPLIPKTVADRIANGENALRVLRKWRGVPQLYLSFKTDIGQGYLSDLENGRRKGTAEVWKRIAKVLNVPLDLLVRCRSAPARRTKIRRSRLRRFRAHARKETSPSRSCIDRLRRALRNFVVRGCDAHAADHGFCDRSLIG